MLSVSKRESLRKLVEYDLVNYFVGTGYARQTIFNTLNKLASGQPINYHKLTDRHIS